MCYFTQMGSQVLVENLLRGAGRYAYISILSGGLKSIPRSLSDLRLTGVALKKRLELPRGCMDAPTFLGCNAPKMEKKPYFRANSKTPKLKTLCDYKSF